MSTRAPLPERAPHLTSAEQGVYRKYVVKRADGTDRPGGRHYGREYFVLDVDHDPAAKVALAAYAAATERPHPQLAAELRERFELPQGNALWRIGPLTPAAAKILGMICFQCIRPANTLRMLGHKIDTKAEAEQAAVLHHLLGFYASHGDGWAEAANADARARLPALDRRPSEGVGGGAENKEAAIPGEKTGAPAGGGEDDGRQSPAVNASGLAAKDDDQVSGLTAEDVNHGAAAQLETSGASSPVQPAGDAGSQP